MKTNKFSDLTINELNKQKSSLNRILLGTGIVMLILCTVLLYLISKSQNFALIAVIPCILLTMLPGIIKLSQINAEIKSRDSKSTAL
ncbi:hypothetical protein MMC2321_02633 [Chitinophaga sp. MM2321]